jgi:hypothetical protein
VPHRTSELRFWLKISILDKDSAFIKYQMLKSRYHCRLNY